MIDETWMLIGLLALVFGALVAIAALSNRGSLNSIKNKTVGDGQYGTARWARSARATGGYHSGRPYGERESSSQKPRAWCWAALGKRTGWPLWWTVMTSTA